jgi:hypothetical protein
MFVNEYVVEKLRELDEERLTAAAAKQYGMATAGETTQRTKPVIGPVMRLAGRTLRRAGEGLEGWASPRQPEGEARWAERHTG